MIPQATNYSSLLNHQNLKEKEIFPTNIDRSRKRVFLKNPSSSINDYPKEARIESSYSRPRWKQFQKAPSRILRKLRLKKKKDATIYIYFHKDTQQHYIGGKPTIRTVKSSEKHTHLDDTDYDQYVKSKAKNLLQNSRD